MYLAGTVIASMGNVLHIHDPGGAIATAWNGKVEKGSGYFLLPCLWAFVAFFGPRMGGRSPVDACDILSSVVPAGLAFSGKTRPHAGKRQPGCDHV